MLTRVQNVRAIQPAPQCCRPFQGSTLRRTRAARAEEKIPGPEANLKATVENPDSDMAQKQQEIVDLRAQEQWMKVGTGLADCISCGYKYDPKKGDPEYPINSGTRFQELPRDWQCPVCGADKQTFQVAETEIAGFAANQGYGLGTNSMTQGQKSGLIYGSLLVFFFLFLCGYFLT